jgi:hypothetical protein
VSLRRIERELRQAIRRSSRPHLETGLRNVGFTDDGGTIYVHAFAREDWPLVRPGDAFVLAHADYPDLRTCAGMRTLIEEARLYMEDETEKVLRWLEGK